MDDKITTKRAQGRSRQARWRDKNREDSIAATKAWRDNHPGWWRGKEMFKSLNRAIARDNWNSKIWLASGLTMGRWLERLSFGGPAPFQDTLIKAVNNGSQLVPIVGWREFDLSKPAQVRKFLAPGNWKLVKRESPND